MIQSLRSYFHTAVTDLRYQGVEVLMWRVVQKLLLPFLRVDLQILFDFDLTRPFEVRKARVDCQIELATEADIDDILDMQMPRLAAEQVAALKDEQEIQYAQMLRARAVAFQTYLRQLRAGELCFVARVQGRVAHSNWTQFHDNLPMEGTSVRLQPGEVYTTDGFTVEDLRGKGLHENVATTMLQFAKQRGCHRAYTITDITKAGSRRGVKRIGWHWRGVVLFVTPRGFKRTWLLRLGGDLEPIFAQARALSAHP